LDEIERERIIRRGRKAKEVLANEAYQDALGAVVNDLFAQFLATAAPDEVDRDALWATGQAVDRINRQLEAFVGSSMVEEQNKTHDLKRN